MQQNQNPNQGTQGAGGGSSDRGFGKSPSTNRPGQAGTPNRGQQQTNRGQQQTNPGQQSTTQRQTQQRSTQPNP